MTAAEFLERGREAESAGDVETAETSYHQADELGDAEGAWALGALLKRKGDLAGAEEAFGRAEQRGFPEAANSLGVLMQDRGDANGATAAYLRAIAAGSRFGELSLGLLYATQGDAEHGVPYLRVAEQKGFTDASWAIGELLRERKDFAGAAEAYRKAADAGHANAAYDLVLVLLDLGDMPGAVVAVQRARELGHPGADKAMALLAPAVIEAHRREIARGRARLRATWLQSTLAVETAQAKLRPVDVELAERWSNFESLRRTYVQERIVSSHLNIDNRPEAWLTGGPRWSLKPGVAAEFDTRERKARAAFEQAKTKFFGGTDRAIGAKVLGEYAQVLSVLEEVRSAIAQELQHATDIRIRVAKAGREAALQGLSSVAKQAERALEPLPFSLQPWSSRAWAEWPLDGAGTDLRLRYAGLLVPRSDPDLGDNADFGTARIPWFVSLRQNLRLAHEAGGRQEAVGFACSLLLRELASTPPGELQFSFFDPVGLGQSVAEFLELAEYDANLIGGKVWSSASDLNARLAEHTAHIELVIQKYLRSTYETIDEFNAAAGEIAEPYRLLVLFDFPTGFSEESAARLRSILENGPRCGVYTLVLHNRSIASPHGVDVQQLTAGVRTVDLSQDLVDQSEGYALRMLFTPDLPDEVLAKRIIESVGKRAVGRTESTVTFDKVFALYREVGRRGNRVELSMAAGSTDPEDESTWWKDDSTRGLFAPIGQKGAREAAILSFDSSDHAGALLVGRPGSGKSTLLHTYVGALTTLYSPDELELYLIDFKEGVEFKSYAAEGLPHARVVAIESDREFGLSVLQSLASELTRRGELLRATGGRHVGLQALREASQERLPRVLLVFDEFQVLFARNDALGRGAADLLETLIRQGRGFGIHVLLGSQSLSGLDALGSHVPQLLPTRILMASTEADQRRVLGEGNDAGQYLTTHGEGILNGAGGAVESNERFKGALLPEEQRIERLRRLRAKADATWFTRRPMVFEGNAAVPLDGMGAAAFREAMATPGANPVRLRVGAPMTLSGVADVELRREAGSNVLAVVRDGDGDGAGFAPSHGPAYALLVASLASASQSPAQLDVIGFLSVDDGLDEIVEPLLDRGRVTLRRRRALGPLLGELVGEVRERVEANDTGRPARLLLLFGIHRARELDADIGSVDADPELSDALEQIMRDGPEVGVHVWVWADTVSGAARRLSSRMMRECSWRIAGRMSGDDSVKLLGSERASELRESQLLLNNEDRGVQTRAMTFGLPSKQWLADLFDDRPRQTQP